MTKPKKKRRPLRAIGMTLITLMLIGMTCLGICGTAFAYYIREHVSKDIDIDLDCASGNCAATPTLFEGMDRE